MANRARRLGLVTTSASARVDGKDRLELRARLFPQGYIKYCLQEAKEPLYVRLLGQPVKPAEVYAANEAYADEYIKNIEVI